MASPIGQSAPRISCHAFSRYFMPSREYQPECAWSELWDDTGLCQLDRPRISSSTQLCLHCSELLDPELQILRAVCRGQLHTDSGLSHGHNGVGESDHIDSFL